MKNILSILVLALAFHLLFWEAGLGLNALLFSGATTGLATWLKPTITRRPMVIALLAGWCASALLVFIHHSALSIAVFWVFLFVLVGYLQAADVRFWLVGIVESFRGLFLGWLISIRQLGNNASPDQDWQTTWRQLRLWFIPIVILIPFYLIYSNANSTLGAINTQLETWLGQLFQFELDWSRAIIFLLGWILVVAILGQRQGMPMLHNWLKDWQFSLVRKRSRLPWSARTMGLKYEFETATYTFWVLNGLLLLVNCFDLIGVWFSPQERTATELSQYVHEGTWLLIFSIVLAMLVVLIFMRGNLNFYPHNQRLKQLALVWLGQNAFLAFSVGIRNGHYIHQYGLAHGRIVVVFFLLLVLFGLYTMYLKITGPLTTFYLLEMNGRAALLGLLLAAAVNWDSFITRYNLSQPEPDIYHMTALLDNNLVPLLEAVQDATPPIDKKDQAIIIREAKRLEQLGAQRDWRSWNWSTHRQLKAWYAFQKKN